MQNLKRVATVLTAVIALAACAPATPPPVDTTADEATIHASAKAWFDAYNAGDADRIVALYANDGVMMPPGTSAAVGHDAMRAFVTADIAHAKAGGVTLVDGTSSMGISGDLCWHSGSYKVTTAAGDAVDSGNYMEVWRRADGKWLILRDIWNSDRPPALPAAAAAAAPATPAP